VYSRGSELNAEGDVADPTSNVTRPKQQVWAVDVDKGEPRYLGDLDCAREGCEDVELSPDGTTAVWAARGQLWVAPVSGATPAHQLAFVRGENDSPKWSPDGSEIAFVFFRFAPILGLFTLPMPLAAKLTQSGTAAKSRTDRSRISLKINPCTSSETASFSLPSRTAGTISTP